MLREIVRETVTATADMDVVGELEGDTPISAAIRQFAPDAVVVDSAHPELRAGAGSILTAAAGGLRLLTVEASGRESFLYTLRPVKTALGELSPERLLDAIRDSADDPDQSGRTRRP